MKNIRKLGMAIMLGVLSLSFVACSDDVTTPQEEYVTVNLGITGEYVELSETPLLTRAATKEDLIAIQVYTFENTGVAGGTQTPYAWGNFHSLEGVSIKLLEGKKYLFQVTILTDYCDGSKCMASNNSFTYSSNANNILSWGVYKNEAFYGELENYTPVENGVVQIATKRVNYGAHYIAEGLTEGRLDVEVRSSATAWGHLYTVTLTSANTEDDNIYTFYNIRDAWLGKYKTADELVDYYAEKKLTIRWTKADGSTIPLGDYKVTFKRNVKTTIRIKVGEYGVQSGIVLTREDVVMVDDANEYVIDGGTITEIPITQN